MRGVTQEELREAVGAVLEASMRVTPSLELAGHRAILRAFLDSGLTDSERETVAEVVEELRRPPLNQPGTPMWIRAWVREQAAALAPIAEGK